MAALLQGWRSLVAVVAAAPAYWAWHAGLIAVYGVVRTRYPGAPVQAASQYVPGLTYEFDLAVLVLIVLVPTWRQTRSARGFLPAAVLFLQLLVATLLFLTARPVAAVYIAALAGTYLTLRRPSGEGGGEGTVHPITPAELRALLSPATKARKAMAMMPPTSIRMPLAVGTGASAAPPPAPAVHEAAWAHLHTDLAYVVIAASDDDATLQAFHAAAVARASAANRSHTTAWFHLDPHRWPEVSTVVNVDCRLLSTQLPTLLRIRAGKVEKRLPGVNDDGTTQSHAAVTAASIATFCAADSD